MFNLSGMRDHLFGGVCKIGMIVWLSTKLRSGDDKETMGVPMKDDAGL